MQVHVCLLFWKCFSKTEITQPNLFQPVYILWLILILFITEVIPQVPPPGIVNSWVLLRLCNGLPSYLSWYHLWFFHIWQCCRQLWWDFLSGWWIWRRLTFSLRYGCQCLHQPNNCTLQYHSWRESKDWSSIIDLNSHFPERPSFPNVGICSRCKWCVSIPAVCVGAPVGYDRFQMKGWGQGGDSHQRVPSDSPSLLPEFAPVTWVPRYALHPAPKQHYTHLLPVPLLSTQT